MVLYRSRVPTGFLYLFVSEVCFFVGPLVTPLLLMTSPSDYHRVHTRALGTIGRRIGGEGRGRVVQQEKGPAC